MASHHMYNEVETSWCGSHILFAVHLSLCPPLLQAPCSPVPQAPEESYPHHPTDCLCAFVKVVVAPLPLLPQESSSSSPPMSLFIPNLARLSSSTSPTLPLAKIYASLFSHSGEGKGTPLQYSCLENPMDGGAWWAAVHGVTEGRTRLSDFTFTFPFMHWRRKWQPTPVFLPGESQGRGSLVGCHLWGCTESDTTEVT